VQQVAGQIYQEHPRMIKLILAPIRSIVRFPLVQFAIVIGVILWLQNADGRSIFGQIFNGLDKLVDATVQLCSAAFTIKSFTKSWLTSGFMIAYVYLAGTLLLFLMRLMIIAVVDFVGRSNLLYLRNTIARERGIGAYRAWIPFERIRPAHISQREWEEAYAWPHYRKSSTYFLKPVIAYFVGSQRSSQSSEHYERDDCLANFIKSSSSARLRTRRS
jgi:hypothetical protein